MSGFVMTGLVMTGVGNWLGDAIGVSGGIQNIGSGYAALLGFVVVGLGWLINARLQRHAYRIENARTTVLTEKLELREHLAKIASYLREKRQFPDFSTMRAQHADLHKSVWAILDALELLALDISTGRASERYVIEAQRTLICNIFVAAQAYVTSLRVAMEQKGAYRNLEILFIRLYINRHPYGQYLIEFFLGRPWFDYSYLNFRFRYLLIANNIGIDTDYRKARWPDTLRRMRRLRRIIIVVAHALMLAIVVWLYWRW